MRGNAPHVVMTQNYHQISIWAPKVTSSLSPRLVVPNGVKVPLVAAKVVALSLSAFT